MCTDLQNVHVYVLLILLSQAILIDDLLPLGFVAQFRVYDLR